MKRKHHTPEQIIRKLRDAEAMLGSGKSAEDVCRKLEISESTLHRWRAQYGQMSGQELKHLKALEEENRQLRKLVAGQAFSPRRDRRGRTRHAAALDRASEGPRA